MHLVSFHASMGSVSHKSGFPPTVSVLDWNQSTLLPVVCYNYKHMQCLSTTVDLITKVAHPFLSLLTASAHLFQCLVCTHVGDGVVSFFMTRSLQLWAKQDFMMNTLLKSILAQCPSVLQMTQPWLSHNVQCSNSQDPLTLYCLPDC